MVRAFPELDTSEFPYTEAKIRDSKSFGGLCISPLNEWVGLEGSLSARVGEWLPLSSLATNRYLVVGVNASLHLQSMPWMWSYLDTSTLTQWQLTHPVHPVLNLYFQRCCNWSINESLSLQQTRHFCEAVSTDACSWRGFGGLMRRRSQHSLVQKFELSCRRTESRSV